MNLSDLEDRYGLPSGLLSAVQSVESGGNPKAVSPKGAVGAFQFMPATAQQYGIDPTDPEQSATGAAQMFADLAKKYGGDTAKMLAAYNWGQGNVDRKGLNNAPPETQNYIQKVSAKMDDPAMAWLRANAPQSSDAPAADPAMAWLRANAPKAPPAAEDTGRGDAAIVGLGAGLDRAAAAVRAITPAPIRSGIDWLNDKLGMGQVPSIDPNVQASNAAAIKPLEDKYPVTMAVTENAPQLAAKTPLGMGALAAATTFGSAKDRLESGAASFLGGKVGEGLGRLFGPQSMTAAGAANPYGIPLRAAQTTDSMPIKIMDSVAANLPVSSGVIAKAKDATYGAFNKAVANTFGADASQITPELLGSAKSKIGGTIGDLAGRNNIALDNDLFAGLKAAQARAATELTPDEQTIVNKQIQNIWNSVDPSTMTIPGTMYKAQQSAMGAIGKNRGGTVSSVMGDLRSTLRDAMTRSVTAADSDAWKLANQQYFNMQQVANASKATPGALSPAQLLTQVNQAQKNARFGGGNDLAELAQWAKSKIPDAIPNSGTAQRVWYQKLLTNPLTTIGSLGGAAYGADKMGIDPQYAAEGLLFPYLAARGMAGKPASLLTKQLLTRSGGLLGDELSK